MRKRRVIIMGAGGRDFHNFNVFFRDNDQYEVVAFTAAQIPNIAGRIYPPELAGKLYPRGIPIYPEEDLPELIEKYKVDEVVLAYSDLLFDDVMNKASLVLSKGASFRILGPKDTMLQAQKPVIAVCAVRTGAGKSTTTRYIVNVLRKRGIKVGVVRHPMPYGDLRQQIVQRFTKLEDLDKHNCTIEEREEYEPLIRLGVTVYAGVDYEKVLKLVESENDIIIWDGGNNDFPFFKPNIMITVADPTRPGQEVFSYPGQVNVRLADIILINKVNVAEKASVEKVERNVRSLNPKAVILKAHSVIKVDKPELIEGKRVLVIEDGPSVTHGHLGYGAGYQAALKYGASEIVDPRPYAVGSIKEAYEKYKHLRKVLPALGYGSKQVKELEEVISKIDCDAIILGTPTDLRRIIKIDKPVVRVYYELYFPQKPDLEDILIEKLSRLGIL